jgi:hypothetical protein
VNLEELQDLFFKFFLKSTSINKVSADKMMVRSKGPVWHKKQKEQGIVPEGLRGLDKEATWSFSMADRWIYGHGTFCITTHEIPVVGAFQWMRNSANEAKRMRQHLWRLTNELSYACMDSKADDQKLYFDLKNKKQIQLLTTTRRGMNKTAGRKRMIKELKAKKFRRIYKHRSTTVEPMQGLMADIFDLERCWMRGNESNRWAFAAMGIAVQMAQLRVYRLKKSTWCIKDEVLGL